MISKALEDPNQKENVFLYKCLNNKNVCSVIIDGVICDNVASTTLVDFLYVLITKQFTPYKIQ